MNNWTIKYRLLFLAVLPLTITVIILSILFTAGGLKQFEIEHERRGNAIVRHLAPASEYAVVSENQEILDTLVKATLAEEDVAAVTITNKNGDTLAEVSTSIDAANGSYEARSFSSPIYQSHIEINDFPFSEPMTDKKVRVGTVSIILSNSSTKVLQQQILFENFSIAGLVLLLTIFFALRISKSLSQPLHHMSKAVTLVSEGDFSYTPTSNSRGELGLLETGISSMVRRLHKSKETEKLQRENLENSNSHLKDEIERRKCIEADLREATQLANQANQAKSDFMGNMGHELRTPLNSIIGFTDLLLMEGLEPKHIEYVQNVQNSCNSLTHLIRDILDFSKLESGKLSMISIAFDLRQAIDEVADAAALDCAGKGIELITNYNPDQPNELLGDPGRIRQIITNLVTNAVKFIETGQIIIRAHVTEKENNIAQIHISVEDTGIGIQDNKLETIFERFTQVDSSSTRSYQGLGLGLTISKQLVELMDGSINVDSTFGEGSVFSFDLRLPINNTAPPYSSPTQLIGKSVLIADSNKDASNTLCQTLRYFGMRVDIADDAASALAALHTANADITSYHLAFIDSHIPGMDIDALTHVIQQNKQLARTKLILLSTVDSTNQRSKALNSGFSAILTKPIHFHELSDSLRRIFSEFKKTTSTQKNKNPLHTDKQSKQDNLRHSERILVVDDNAMNLKLATNVLGKLGYSSNAATTGYEAIEILEDSFYEIILMDILMPHMNGFEATKKIRDIQASSGQRSTIIALTAKALSGDRERCLEAGMDEYLSKPLQINKLKELLKTFSNKEENQSLTTD